VRGSIYSGAFLNRAGRSRAENARLLFNGIGKKIRMHFLLMLASVGLVFAGCATGYGERESGMSLGMGIFLSSLVLGPIVLIIGTKDRWNWKRIILWPFTGLILIAIALWIYTKIDARAYDQTTFWDIPLGATKGDVKFLKGAPIFEDADSYLFANNSGNNDHVYEILFKNDKVWLIKYFTISNHTNDPGIQGIHIGDSLEKITQKFGPSSSISASNDELDRVFSFKDYHVFFAMNKNRVTYGVFDPTIAPRGVEYPKDYFDLVAEKDRWKQTKRTTLINKSKQ
jgi:hypothetical protein